MNRSRLLPHGAMLFGSILAGCATGPFSKGESAGLTEPLRIEALYRVTGEEATTEILYRAASADIAAGRYERAIATLQRIVQKQIDHIDALNAMAVALAQQGRQDDAIAMLERALSISPDSSALHNNLGYALVRASRYDQAKVHLERARTLDPTNQTAAANLDKLAAASRQQEQAAEASRSLSADRMDVGSELGESQPSVAPVPGRAIAAEGAWNGVTVVSAADDHSSLVRVSTNVYELRPAAGRQADLAAAPSAPRDSTAAGHRGPAPASPHGGADSAAVTKRRAWIEVSNGVGVKGLARRMAANLNGSDFKAARISDYRGFGQASTTIQYRSRYADDARALLESLPVQARMVRVEDGALRADIGIRLVLGRDAVTPSSVAAVSRESAVAGEADRT